MLVKNYSNLKERNIFGFDVETYTAKNKFLMGSIYGKDLKRIFWDQDSFISFLERRANTTFRSAYIFGVNMGFDITALLDNTRLLSKLYPIIKNSKMIKAVVKAKNRNLQFLDTFNFLPFSADKWGKILGLNKLEKPSFLGNKPKNNIEKDYLEEYNLMDSKIAYMAGFFLQKGFNALGCNMKITIASTALDLYRRKYIPKTFYKHQLKYLNYLYKGYYGGRCEAIKRGYVENINYYDINSLYPSVMINEYPDPNKFYFRNNINLNEMLDYEGVADVTIKAPDLYIPYLPLRSDKLIFPTGAFRGHYAIFELRNALKLGYEILKIHSAMIYPDRIRPFKDYISDLYKMRMNFKKLGSPMQLLTKILLNSLYGKFSQRIESRETIIPIKEITMEMIRKAQYIEKQENFILLKYPYNYIPSFVNPIFSIYTTAYARHVLYKTLSRYPENIYYYDTDSVFIDRKLETSKELGGWKQELKNEKGIIVKPKMYVLGNYVKCKGVNKITMPDFLSILKGNPVNITRFVKFKEANRRHLTYNEIISFTKDLDLEDTKRKWENAYNHKVLEDSKPIFCEI